MTAFPAAVSWFGQPPEALGSDRGNHLSAALYRIDRAEELRFDAHLPSGRHLVCAHLAGTIDWECRFDERRYMRPCDCGTFSIARDGEVGQVRMRDAKAIFLHFYLPTEWLNACAEELGHQSTVELIDPMNGHDREVERFALSTAAAMNERGPGLRLQVEAATLLLASCLLHRYSNASPKALAIGGLATWQVRRVIEMIEEADGATISIEKLAASVGLSSFHFCRAFKISTGMAPHQFLVSRRIARAKTLLALGRSSVSDIAAQVGYDDPNQLARMFRKEIGLSPSQYRRAVGS